MEWNNTGADSYGVYKGTSFNNLQFAFITFAPDFTDAGVQGGVIYYYAITSLTNDGYESPKSGITPVQIPRDSNGGGC
jgi:fibronectin type 3 domain-containing protein